MHICIIGNGAAGLLSCLSLSIHPKVKKITLIGSPTIPSIGVGESTTVGMNRLLNKIGVSDVDFIKNTDATIKYGVYYKNWSSRDYIHYIKSHNPWNRENINSEAYAKLLANKPKDTFIHDLIGNNLFRQINKNRVLLDKEEYPHTWNFDAAKGIQFLKSISEKRDNVNLVYANVIDCIFGDNDYINEIVLNTNEKIKADYYINASGNWEFNSKIFKTEYESLSDFLLTNKALFTPI
jgi:tryptophan 7-halogenase